MEQASLESEQAVPEEQVEEVEETSPTEEPVVKEEQLQENKDVVEEPSVQEEQDAPEEEQQSAVNDDSVRDSSEPEKPKKKKSKLALIIILIVGLLAIIGGSTTAAVIIIRNRNSAYGSPSNNPRSTSETRSSSSKKSSSKSSSSKASSSSSKASSSSSIYNGPQVDVSSVNVLKKSNKVYLQIQGQTTSTSNLNIAFALNHYDTSSYIVGSASFSNSDYKYNTPVANGSFTFEYCLSDVSGIEAGVFTITAAIQGYTFDLGTANSGTRVKDDNYRYYIRTDTRVGSVNALAIDQLPPFDMTEASIVTIGTKIYAKVGGNNRTGVTQSYLDGCDSYVELELTSSGYKTTLRDKDKGEYYYEVSGSKAYIYIDVGFFTAGKTFNTHLNVTKYEQADCKMDASINQHYVVVNDNKDFIDIQIYANPSAASDDKNEIYGNLGFIVTAA